jgi:hypothetical protein
MILLGTFLIIPVEIQNPIGPQKALPLGVIHMLEEIVTHLVRRDIF